LHKMVFIGMANNPITTIHNFGITDAESWASKGSLPTES
jgi:hypothetical protein